MKLDILKLNKCSRKGLGWFKSQQLGNAESWRWRENHNPRPCIGRLWAASPLQSDAMAPRAWCFPTRVFSLLRTDRTPATSGATRAMLLKAALIGFLHAAPTSFLDVQLCPCAVVSGSKCSPAQMWPSHFQWL